MNLATNKLHKFETFKNDVNLVYQYSHNLRFHKFFKVCLLVVFFVGYTPVEN